MTVGQEFIPYKTFVGAFIPEGLMVYTGISSSAKLVWARLARYAGERGLAYPSQTTLARECGISRRGCQMALDALEKHQFLTRKGVIDKCTVYGFLVHQCLVAPAHNVRTPQDQDAPKPVQNVRTSEKTAETSAKNALQTDLHAQKVRSTGAKSAHKESHEESHREFREGTCIFERSDSARASPQAPLNKTWELFNAMFFPGVPSEVDNVTLTELIGEHGHDAVYDALVEAQKYHKLRRATLPYISAILDRKRKEEKLAGIIGDTWR